MCCRLGQIVTGKGAECAGCLAGPACAVVVFRDFRVNLRELAVQRRVLLQLGPVVLLSQPAGLVSFRNTQQKVPQLTSTIVVGPSPTNFSSTLPINHCQPLIQITDLRAPYLSLAPRLLRVCEQFHVYQRLRSPAAAHAQPCHVPIQITASSPIPITASSPT